MKDKQKVFSFTGHILLPDDFNGDWNDALDYITEYRRSKDLTFTEPENAIDLENESDKTFEDALWDYFFTNSSMDNKRMSYMFSLTEYNEQTNLMDTIRIN